MIHDVSAASIRSTPSSSSKTGTSPGRKVGDGASHVVLEQLRITRTTQPQDHLCYLTRTPDGKILKSSIDVHPRQRGGKVVAILGINYDISALLMVESAVRDADPPRTTRTQTEPEKIINVNDVLDELIAPVGRPGGQARGADEQGGQDARPSAF